MNAPVSFPMDLTHRVIAYVAERHGLTAAAIIGPNTRRRYAWPRQEAYFEVHRQRPNLSLPQIGATFGGRDHTTILHGIRQHEARMAWSGILVWAGADDQPDLFARAA